MNLILPQKEEKLTKRKWDYQADYTQWHCLLDAIEFWIWKHIHWLWWAYQSTLQWLRDRRQKRKQEYYNAGFEQGKFEERERILSLLTKSHRGYDGWYCLFTKSREIWQALQGEK